MVFPHATKAFPWPMPLLSVKTRSLGVILHISDVASPTPHAQVVPESLLRFVLDPVQLTLILP